MNISGLQTTWSLSQLLSSAAVARRPERGMAGFHQNLRQKAAAGFGPWAVVSAARTLVIVLTLSLQANVMLEYDIDEAQALLEKNLLTATKNLDSLEEDLDFLRDQFTTTEVSILSWKRNEEEGEGCF